MTKRLCDLCRSVAATLLEAAIRYSARSKNRLFLLLLDSSIVFKSALKRCLSLLHISLCSSISDESFRSERIARDQRVFLCGVHCSESSTLPEREKSSIL